MLYIFNFIQIFKLYAFNQINVVNLNNWAVSFLFVKTVGST